MVTAGAARDVGSAAGGCAGAAATAATPVRGGRRDRGRRDRDLGRGGCGSLRQGRDPVVRLRDARGDAELAHCEVVVDRELDARRRQQGVRLAPRVLGQVLLQLADEGALVGDELLAVGAREVDRVLVRDVDPGDGHRAVLVHLLGQLARQLDGLHVRPEGATENAFEKALDRALDASQDAHSRESDSRLRVAGNPHGNGREDGAEHDRPEGDRAGSAAPARGAPTSAIWQAPSTEIPFSPWRRASGRTRQRGRARERERRAPSCRAGRSREPGRRP